jgi:hypothetical protein
MEAPAVTRPRSGSRGVSRLRQRAIDTGIGSKLSRRRHQKHAGPRSATLVEEVTESGLGLAGFDERNGTVTIRITA